MKGKLWESSTAGSNRLLRHFRIQLLIHCNFMLTGLKFKVSSGIYKKYKMLVTPFFNVTGIIIMHLATVHRYSSAAHLPVVLCGADTP